MNVLYINIRSKLLQYVFFAIALQVLNYKTTSIIYKSLMILF